MSSKPTVGCGNYSYLVCLLASGHFCTTLYSRSISQTIRIEHSRQQWSNKEHTRRFSGKRKDLRNKLRQLLKQRQEELNKKNDKMKKQLKSIKYFEFISYLLLIGFTEVIVVLNIVHYSQQVWFWEVINFKISKC